MSRRGGEPATLRGLALVSLFLLSVVAAGSAGLAWHPPASSAWWQGAAAFLLAASLLSGESVAALRSRMGAWMPGGIWTAQLVYAGAAALTLLSLFGPPTRGFLGRASLGFGFVQCVLLALSAADPHRALPLMNALLLLVLASLAGGPLAAVAVVAFAPLLVAFLVFDHHARRLALHRRGESGLVGVALREAAARGVLAALALAGCFQLLPPMPLAGVVGGDGGLSPRELAEIHAKLALIGIVGATLVYLADRLRQRRERPEPPAAERLVAERSEEEALLPEPERRAPASSEARARIVRAWAAVLRAGAAAGSTRRPGQTAQELASRLDASPAALRTLARLFDGARYGAAEPSPAEVQGAMTLSRLVREELSLRAAPGAGSVRRSRSEPRGSRLR